VPPLHPDAPGHDPGAPSSHLDPDDPTGPPPPGWGDRLALLTSPPPLPGRRLLVGAAVAVVAVVVGVAVLRPAPAPPELSIPMATAGGGAAAGAPGGASAGGGGEGGGAAAGAGTPVGGGAGTTSSTTAGTVTVHAAGAVARPGVYRLGAGARVAELLEAAGGPAAGADLDRLNLAAPLVDGAQVHVPREGEAPVVAAGPAPGGSAGVGVAAGPAGPVDLNAATVEELDRLPGVGPTIAAAIVEERERRGGFRTVDDLLDVRGIGEVRLAELRDRVRV
jgi:competence protein ComEA